MAQAVTVVRKSSIDELLEQINSLSKYQTIYFIPCTNNPGLKQEAVDVVDVDTLKKYVEFANKLMDRSLTRYIVLQGCIDCDNKAYITEMSIGSDDDEW